MTGSIPYPLAAGGNGDVEVCIDLFERKPTASRPSPRPFHEICGKGSTGRRRVQIQRHSASGGQDGKATEVLKDKTVRFNFRKSAIGSPGHYFWRWSTSDDIDGPVDDAPDSPGTVRLGLGG
jgi:hypothetical protein